MYHLKDKQNIIIASGSSINDLKKQLDRQDYYAHFFFLYDWEKQVIKENWKPYILYTERWKQKPDLF